MPIAGRFALGACLALMSISHAALGQTPLTGILNGTGSLVLSPSGITFVNAGTGTFKVDITSTGSFAPLALTTASIQSIGQAVVAGTPTSVPNFITFAAQPTASVTLTLLLPGAFTSAACAAAPAVAQTCTPTGSPFSFTNVTATSSTVSFAIAGTASNAGAPSSITAVFTAQLSDRSYQSVLASLAAAGSLATTYSATLRATALSAGAVPASGSAR